MGKVWKNPYFSHTMGSVFPILWEMYGNQFPYYRKCLGTNSHNMGKVWEPIPILWERYGNQFPYYGKGMGNQVEEIWRWNPDYGKCMGKHILFPYYGNLRFPYYGKGMVPKLTKYEFETQTMGNVWENPNFSPTMGIYISHTMGKDWELFPILWDMSGNSFP